MYYQQWTVALLLGGVVHCSSKCSWPEQWSTFKLLKTDHFFSSPLIQAWSLSSSAQLRKTWRHDVTRRKCLDCKPCLYVIPFRSPSVTCWLGRDGYFRFAFWLVESLRGTPSAGSQAVRHEEDLVVVFTGSLANIALQVTPGERERERHREHQAPPVRSDWDFLFCLKQWKSCLLRGANS